MIYKFKNFSFQNPKCEDGDSFEYCNLTQAIPNTVICESNSKLTFKSCNLLNCKLPADSVVDDCLTVQIDRCTNLHPELIAEGIKKCSENCKHVAGSSKVPVLVTKEEYISAKVSSPVSVSANAVTDANGIITQTFVKQAYKYQDTVLANLKEVAK